MADKVKSAVSLTSILNNFEKLLNKTAEPLVSSDANNVGSADIADIPPAAEQPNVTNQQIESAAAAVVDAQKQEELEKAEVTQATEQKIDAIEVLKDIAKSAALKEEKTMMKEAGEFGKIFAHEFLQELEVNSMIKSAAERAYNDTNADVFHEQLKKVASEAYDMANEDFLKKVAGEAYDLCNVSLTKDIFRKIAGEAYELTTNSLGSEG